MQNDTIKTTWIVYITNVIPFYFLSFARLPTNSLDPSFVRSAEKYQRTWKCECECACQRVCCTPFHKLQRPSLSFVHTSITTVPLIVYLILCHFMMTLLAFFSFLSLSFARSVHMDRAFLLNLLLLALHDSLVCLFSCTNFEYMYFYSGSAEKVKKAKTTIRHQKKKNSSCNVSKVVFVFDSTALVVTTKNNTGIGFYFAFIRMFRWDNLIHWGVKADRGLSLRCALGIVCCDFLVGFAHMPFASLPENWKSRSYA